MPHGHAACACFSTSPFFHFPHNHSGQVRVRASTVLPNPRFRRPIGLLLTSAPRLSKPYRYFATFVLLLTYLPRNVLEIGRLCEKLSISCQFRGILNFFNVNEHINHKLIGLRRHTEPSKSFESDYPQLPEVGQSIVFPPIWVIFG